MQHKSNWTMLALALAGAVAMTTGSAEAQQPAPAPADQPTCEEHRFALTVGSRATEASARSCLHPDGSLDVVQQTPGLPVQSFHLTPADVACGGAGQSSCSGAPPQVDQAGCRSYSLPVAIEGATRTATRRACPQADGGWQVTQTVPGLPLQSYVIAANVVASDTAAQPYAAPGYAPSAVAYPCSPYYPYYPCYPAYPAVWGYDPWFFGPPFFFGSVAIAFDHFHHSHRFDHFHDGGHAHFSHPTTAGAHFHDGGARFSGSSPHFSGGGTHFSGGGAHFSGGGGGHFSGGGRR